MLRQLLYSRSEAAQRRSYADFVPPMATVDDLSPRQREILLLHIRGTSRDEIAGQLQISANTVRNHVQAIYDRIGCANRVQALRWALQQPAIAGEITGWIPGPAPQIQTRSLVDQEDHDLDGSVFEVALAIRFFRELVLAEEADHESN